MTKPIVLLLSGPNLNLFGQRDPAVYGTTTLDEFVTAAREVAEAAGFTLEHVQSNSENELIDAVHAARNRCRSIVINGAALTHYAWGLHDALQMFDGRVVEVHVSNIARRESWRHTSVISPVADGLVAGLGIDGYRAATAFACSDR